ncbi:MAG TPA: biotin/lipoyl-binding protein [Solirubrobacteraceae bacterium]|nr:biotin/lipoyl-binding protein [Solirubrobacteraceae bacterium]
MTNHSRPSLLIYALAVACVGAIVAAVLVVGPASGSETTVTRTATAAQGVVQSTVSGSGNLQSASQLNLGFKTSGTVSHIYVSQGQNVTQGQLLATLDPESAEVSLEQAKAALLTAEATLAQEEERGGETSSGSGTGNSGTSSGAGADNSSAGADGSSASTDNSSAAADGSSAGTDDSSSGTGTGNSSATTRSSGTGTGNSSATSGSSSSDTGSSAGAPGTRTTATTVEKPAQSQATREANLASARAAVKSDKLTVQSAEAALQDTKLYAPQSGTLVSLSGQVGEVVSGSGTTRAASSSSGSSGSGSSAATTGTGASARSATGASSSSSASDSNGSSGSSGSTSTAFAVLSDLSSMHLVVALSESEISNVKVGQIATVTVEALEGRKLAAHVSEVALTSSSSSGAVSYDVTFQLDQMDPGLKLGMSATAEVVVKQAEGVNVPTSAISAGTVTVKRGGSQVRQRVVTGLEGNTSTIILSGLNAGETVVLPSVSSTGSGAASITSRLSRLGVGGGGGGGGLAGAGGLAAPGGGAALFRGAG